MSQAEQETAVMMFDAMPFGPGRGHNSELQALISFRCQVIL